VLRDLADGDLAGCRRGTEFDATTSGACSPKKIGKARLDRRNKTSNFIREWERGGGGELTTSGVEIEPGARAVALGGMLIKVPFTRVVIKVNIKRYRFMQL
jgi:hypothetical protein